jgi:hypothetical protein
MRNNVSIVVRPEIPRSSRPINDIPDQTRKVPRTIVSVAKYHSVSINPALEVPRETKNQ